MRRGRLRLVVPIGFDRRDFGSEDRRGILISGPGLDSWICELSLDGRRRSRMLRSRIQLGMDQVVLHRWMGCE
jgi:hypothetical protein